jgi:hypothetical protein
MYSRAYLLNEEGRIRSFRELVCLNDEEARLSNWSTGTTLKCGRKRGRFSQSGMPTKVRTFSLDGGNLQWLLKESVVRRSVWVLLPRH